MKTDNYERNHVQLYIEKTLYLLTIRNKDIMIKEENKQMI